jgi:thymidylate kinase
MTMKSVLDNMTKLDAGPGFILLHVFETLDRAGIPYCVLHGYEGYPERIKSDVDCLISAEIGPGQLGALLHENRAGLGADLVRQRGYHVVLGTRKPDGSPCFLDLDMSVHYELNGRFFYTGDEILASRRRHKQFWVPAARMEFGCYLVRKIAKGSLDEEQGRRLSSLYREDATGCQEQIGRFWAGGSAELIASAASSGNWAPVRHCLGPLGAELLRGVTRRHPFRTFGSWLAGLAGRVRRGCRPDAGLHVVFLGPDGAGKSSVIRAVSQGVAGAFAGTRCYTFPPALMRRLLCRPPGPESLPHALPPRSFLGSMIRALSYWLAYYSLGYYLTAHLALARSNLVLHDRHLVDALVDPRRYRYGGPAWVLRLIWRLVPKPDLVILLDAPPEVLHARKQEVPLPEIARQQRAYWSLVTRMGNGHVVDADRPLEQVVEDINDLILGHLTRRIARRLPLIQRRVVGRIANPSHPRQA